MHRWGKVIPYDGRERAPGFSNPKNPAMSRKNLALIVM
jgi:hypothetical protein